MTDEELDAIETRCNAAQPGPWLTPEEVGDPYAVQVIDHEGCYVWPWRGRAERHGDHEQGEKDMVFAYAARTDVPRLIAEIRRLRATLADPSPQA